MKDPPLTEFTICGHPCPSDRSWVDGPSSCGFPTTSGRAAGYTVVGGRAWGRRWQEEVPPVYTFPGWAPDGVEWW